MNYSGISIGVILKTQSDGDFFLVLSVGGFLI